MDYRTAFAISATGMNVEKMRVEMVALNLANASSVAGPDGELYQPRRVVTRSSESTSFAMHIGGALRNISLPTGVELEDIGFSDTAPRRVYDPTHPVADDRGYVNYPNINPVSEMLELIEATRAYEANVRALNAAKTMASTALEIGSRR